MPRQMARGPAGRHGRPARQGRKAGQESATILHLKGAGHPAWAQPIRIVDAKRSISSST